MPDESNLSPDLIRLIFDYLERALPTIKHISSKATKGSKTQIALRARKTYKSYLENSAERYGKAKTFFTRGEPLDLYDFYVPLGVKLGKKNLSKVNFSDITNLSSRSVVIGSGGSGKSMLMRHLFLSSLQSGDKVPILVELRKVNSEKGTVIDLINSSLISMGFDLGEDYVDKALKEGHFSIFLDGYDEVEHSLRKNISKEIVKISSKYKSCVFILSSRPDDIFHGWDDFATLELCPLSKDEAAKLISHLPHDEEIKNRFTNDLREFLYDRHKSFLSNPLLLSIMLLTYKENADIPNKLSLFYNQAYEALFQQHDAQKGAYKRDRKTDLDIQDFGRVFAAFSLQSYDNRSFSFSHEMALEYANKSQSVTRIKYNSSDFISDAFQSVCLLIEDGLLLAYAHRSFQEYFVARFIKDAAPKIQSALIEKYWTNIQSDKVMELLFEIDPSLFERTLLIPKLNDFFNSIGVKRSIGITHFSKYLKNTWEEFTLALEPSFEDGEEDIARLSAKGYPSRVPYIDVARIAMKDDFPPIDRDALRSFVTKYSEPDEVSTCIETRNLTYKAPFVQDISKLGGLFGRQFLESAYQLLKDAEQRNRNEEKTLDELLKD